MWLGWGLWDSRCRLSCKMTGTLCLLYCYTYEGSNFFILNNQGNWILQTYPLIWQLLGHFAQFFGVESLKFSQRCYWRFKAFRIWRHVDWQTVDFVKERNASNIFLGRIWPWNEKPQSFDTSTTIYHRSAAKHPRKFESVISPYYRPRRPRGGVEVQLYSFLNVVAKWGWVINARNWSFYLRDGHGTNCIGVWPVPRTSLDKCGKSRLPPGLDRWASSQ